MAQRPSIRRRRLIAALRQLREQAGLTITEAAARADWDPSKLSRIERFETPITGDDTLNFCEALDAEQSLANTLAKLARESRRRGWWHVYNDVLGEFADFVELEADAKRVMEWEADVIPGPLQTEEYARAVIRHAWPEDTDEANAQRVQLRMERQKRMQDGPARLWVILDEAILRRPVGGHMAMAQQLDHLVHISGTPQVTMQILPTGLAGHSALGVPFTLIDLNDGASYAYIESITGGFYVESPTDVERYQTAWSRLVAESLDFTRSLETVRQHATEHRSTHDRAGNGGNVA